MNHVMPKSPRLKHQIIPRIQLKHITRNYFFSRPNFFTTFYDYYEKIWIIWVASKIDPNPKGVNCDCDSCDSNPRVLGQDYQKRKSIEMLKEKTIRPQNHQFLTGNLSKNYLSVFEPFQLFLFLKLNLACLNLFLS